MKPLHLQQTRYEVRQCKVWSARAADGFIWCWYIFDTLNDTETWGFPRIERRYTFKTRKQAVAWLNTQLAKEQVG